MKIFLTFHICLGRQRGAVAGGYGSLEPALGVAGTRWLMSQQKCRALSFPPINSPLWSSPHKVHEATEGQGGNHMRRRVLDPECHEGSAGQVMKECRVGGGNLSWEINLNCKNKGKIKQKEGKRG